MTTTTTTPDTVTFVLTHAAYSALGLDEDGMLENRSLERALSFKVLSRGVRYTLPLDAARDLYRALDSSHMIEPESIALVGLGEYNAACALHRTVGRLVGEAEARVEAREVQARLEAASEAIDAIEEAETESVSRLLTQANLCADRVDGREERPDGWTEESDLARWIFSLLRVAWSRYPDDAQARAEEALELGTYYRPDRWGDGEFSARGLMQEVAEDYDAVPRLVSIAALIRERGIMEDIHTPC